jgi:hypothetical protein
MELKEFIKETLVQIVTGVKEAQQLLKTEGALIAPPRESQGKEHWIKDNEGKLRSVELVEFEVGLTSDQDNKSNMKIGVAFGGLSVSNAGRDHIGGRSVTSIRFSVPVVYAKE